MKKNKRWVLLVLLLMLTVAFLGINGYRKQVQEKR